MRVRTMRMFVSAAVISAVATTSAFPQGTCPDMGGITKKIRDRYDGQFKSIEAEARQMQDDFKKPSPGGAMVGTDVIVEWVDQRWIFDLPSVSIRDQRMVFGTPSVTVRDQDIIFHTPSVRMKTRKCGQYPEVHGWTVRWSDILCDVPETFMQEHRVRLGVPEFFMEEQEIIVGVPEFEMNRQEWVMRIPEFTVINVKAEVTAMKDDGEALRAKSDSIALAMKSELVAALATGFDCYENNLVNQRTLLATQMDLAIQQMNVAIQQITANGGDPTNIGGNLIARRDALVSEKEAQLAKMDEVIASLQAKERDAIAKLSPETTNAA